MRKALIVFLCAALLLPVFVFALPVSAADSYLITIAEESVLTDVSNNGMAAYIDGIIYIPYHTITHLDGVKVNYSAAGQFVTVFRVGAMMTFELDTGQTYNPITKQAFPLSAKMRGDVPYLPAAILATWMNMSFSVTRESVSGVNYPVLRLCGNAPDTDDKTVINRLARQLRSVSQKRDQASGLSLPPEDLPERQLALVFTGHAGLNAEGQCLQSSLLDALEAYKLQAGFFFAEEELLPSAEDLREVYGRGFTPGILITDDTDPVAQAKRCAELYSQLLHARIRLVFSAVELSDVQRGALQDAGFLLWQAHHDPDDGEMNSAKVLTAARKSLRDAPTQSVLRLRPTQTTVDLLPALYSYLNAQNFTVYALNEWTKPY